MEIRILPRCARLLVATGFSLWLASAAPAVTILQAPGTNAVGLEAEANVTLTAGTPVNALQLVRVLAALQISAGSSVGQTTVSWSRASTGYTLESSPTPGPTAPWQAVTDVANPLSGAGSTGVDTTGGARFFVYSDSRRRWRDG